LNSGRCSPDSSGKGKCELNNSLVIEIDSKGVFRFID
jgi:hypothetical protein